jgi:RHS repeat-associated protein
MISGAEETTVYSGPFEAWTSAGVTQYRYHLMADDREVAEVDLQSNGSGVTEAVKYILTDHLGSVDVVTDQSGNIMVENGVQTAFSFGAFGARRNPTTWMKPQSSSQVTADHAADRYGFTHQEMLDNVGLIHMNGRVYDPNLGRFLSVDPVFAFPTNTQSLNPYSYVLNNPLSYTDPTGYTPDCATGQSGCNLSDIKAKDIESVQKTSNGQLVVNTKDGKSYAVDSASGLKDQKTGGTFSINFTGNGYAKTEMANAAQTKPTDTASINSPESTARTEATGTSVTASGAGAQTASGKLPDNLSLTPEQRQKALQIAANPYDPKSPTEAFQLIRNSDGSETKRSTDGCTEASCPAFSNAVEVHWHVDVSNPQNPLTSEQANLTREFPGPGDHLLLPYNTINVGVTPMGAVWAIERVNGVTELDYLKHSSNPTFDAFVQRNWKPGMDASQIAPLIEKHDP